MRTMGLPYALPCDIEEISRLDFQHYMLRYALQGLYFAPLNNPSSILDVGTGTGRWALEMAQFFPRANVIGVDVNPPPADERAATGVDVRPPNYAFTPGNVLEGLPFEDEVFDFVHMRLLFTAIPSDRWPWWCGSWRG
jgi:ubiquinone/menaquinone biosynthesis C-methylase UbiE